MPSPKRDQMNPGAGKLLDAEDAVFDLTALLKSINAYIAGSGIPVNTDGGSGGGGGSSTYSNIAGDFTAAPNTGAKTITLSSYASSLLSATIAAKNLAAAAVFQISSAGVVTQLPLTNVAIAANVVTLSDMTANFAAGDTVAVFIPGPEKAYDKTNDWRKSAEQLMPQAEDNDVGVIKTEQRFDGGYISTATTTTLKSGAGFLHSITVNGGTAGTIVIYDNTAASGTIIASFDSTNALATYMFNRKFNNGLTIVTSAATKISVSYR